MVDPLPSYPCAKLKLDQFFLQWICEHQDVVNSLLEDAQAGRQIRGPTTGTAPSPLSPSTAHAIFSMTPPLSPNKPRSPRSPLSPQRRSSTLSSLKRPPLSQLPQFYFPNGQQPSDAVKSDFTSRIDKHFEGRGSGLGMEDFSLMCNEVCSLPRMVARVLFRRLAANNNPASDLGLVTKDVFSKFCAQKGIVTAQPMKRLYEVLRKDGQEYLTYDDFVPLMEVLLKYHPGLEFLAETAEFQKKYAETVVFRIFYTINRSGSGRMTLRELRRSDLMEALEQLDAEDDINKVLRYFSYEHFYVIYCKFWELDTDHDFLISKQDLAHYSNCALSYQIIDRVFEQVPRPFSSKVPDRMGYEDFVWFIMSEEDKSTDTALEYWFRCADLDSDGVIRPREMWFFYEEQLKRLEGMRAEAVQFEDVVCQLHDMLQPEVEGQYTLRDLKRTRPQSGLLFNALFNLHKFVDFENRDPFALRAEAAEFGGLSDWDKFAKIEYFRLASEDEGGGQMEAEEATWPEVDAHMAGSNM